MTVAADIEPLWHEYRDKLDAYIRRYIYSADVAEDMVSRVFLRAVVATSRGHGYTSSASGWLYQIARSAIQDYWRQRHAREWAVELDMDISDASSVDSMGGELYLELIASDPTPHEWLERQEIARKVRRAVASLPPAQEDVIVARLQGYDLHEIALGINRSYEATKQLQTRAFANLRQALREAA
jgi:RNA polymerase sigma factor (sigma-70 family)